MAGNKKPKAKASGARKRALSNTPIVLGISQKEKEFIKKIPHLALLQFKEGKGNPNHWHTLGFRLTVGLELAKAVYTQEAEKGMQESFDVIKRIHARYAADRTDIPATETWVLEPEEIELIAMGLEATDTMQDQTTRRDQLHAHHAAKAFTLSPHFFKFRYPISINANTF